MVAETFPLQEISSSGSGTLTSQTVFVTLLGLRVGTTVTGAVISVQTAAVGTAPTGVFLGLYDTTGTLRASTANINSDAKLTSVGRKQFVFQAPYVVAATGGYFVAFLQDGAFTSTAIQLNRGCSSSSQTTALTGGVISAGTAGTSKSALPASGATFTAGATGLWFGLY